MIDKYDVKTTVMIAGQRRLFVDLKLVQSFNAHHEFRIVLNYEAFGQKWMSNPKEIVTLVGEEAVISMVHLLSGTECLFIGLITKVVLSGKNGLENNVVIIGKGQTARLDGKKAMDSFMDKNLEGVVSEAVANSGSGVPIRIEPSHKQKIDYICQYNESDFEFLNRLSYIYGEWFWDTGQEIRFGKGAGSEEAPLRMVYDVNMIDYELSANLVPARFNRYGYLVHYDKEVKSFAMDEVPNARGYHKMVLAKSDQVYSKEGDLPVDAPITDKEELDTMVELERSRAAAEMLTISGTSRTCEVQLGRKVQILMPTRAPMRDIDEFMVTYIEHHVNEADKYSNTFKSILSDLLAIPMEPVEPPRTGNQQATVMSNADPENKGRVQVQLQWQKGLGKSTNWIRVQTPDAGSSGKVKSNRGFVCIPEVGDSVMVGFDYGDPNRPYVMGSVFSELTGAGGGEGNKGKSITTRSGHTLMFDDSVEGLGITLKDSNGNIIHLDAKGQNIDITAPETITFTAKNMVMNISENITINAGKDINSDSNGATNIKATGAASINANGNIDIASSAALTVNASSSTSISSGASMDVSSGANLSISAGGSGDISASGSMTVSSSDTTMI